MEEENDPKLTEEQIMLTNQLNDSELKDIDNALLSNISSQWRKLARVVGSAIMGMENRVNGIPDVFYAQRVKNFVKEGVVESKGNLNRMRYSEVRKA